MKIKEKLLMKVLEAQLGLVKTKEKLDVANYNAKQTVFPAGTNKDWGENTKEHFFIVIILLVMGLGGILWKPLTWITWVALGLYILYNISKYRKIDIQ